MRLIAFLSDNFHGILEVIGLGNNVEFSLTSHDIEQRERLVQTYLIVFGLFLSYNHDLALQKTAMIYFLWFLWLSLIYYSLFTHPLIKARFFYNSIALCMVFLFTLTFYSYLFDFGNCTGSVGDLIAFLFTTVIVAYPLFV